VGRATFATQTGDMSDYDNLELAELTAAHAANRGDSRTHSRIHWQLAGFYAKRGRMLRAFSQAMLALFARLS
jgi:hypothetical protein